MFVTFKLKEKDKENKYAIKCENLAELEDTLTFLNNVREVSYLRVNKRKNHINGRINLSYMDFMEGLVQRVRLCHPV